MIRMLTIFLQGLMIGFSLAAPVGPMAMLCIQRTLLQGLSFGLLTGIGIAVADGVYGLIAVLGLTAISDFLIAYRCVLGVSGGLFLVWLGIKTLRVPAKQVGSLDASITGRLSAFSSAFMLTLTNPITILTYIAIFSSMAIATDGSHLSGLVLIAAILAGSFGWWVFLCGLVSMAKHRLSSTTMHWINMGSGIVLVAFGLYAIGMQIL